MCIWSEWINHKDHLVSIHPIFLFVISLSPWHSFLTFIYLLFCYFEVWFLSLPSSYCFCSLQKNHGHAKYLPRTRVTNRSGLGWNHAVLESGAIFLKDGSRSSTVHIRWIRIHREQKMKDLGPGLVNGSSCRNMYGSGTRPDFLLVIFYVLKLGLIFFRKKIMVQTLSSRSETPNNQISICKPTT